MSSIKKLSSLNFSDLLGDDQKLVFLVGAGSSIDSPSLMPSAYEIMKTLIKFACVESEIEKINQIEELKFETLLEIFYETLDNELLLADLYLQNSIPNLAHFFLVEMAKRGHFIMTANFDSLIEHAMLQSEIQKRRIIPVITEKDYEKYNDPEKLYKGGKYAIYKIHSSPKNIITGEDTKTAFLNTIRLLGQNFEKSNLIQLEPFKAQLLENISNERTLVIFGYSGKNDFDIISTLKIMKNLKNLIWINHTSTDTITEEIYKIETQKEEIKKIDELDSFLLDVMQINDTINVYRMDTNTSKLLDKYLEKKDLISSEKFTFNLMGWLQENIKKPDEITKLYFSFKIYYETKRYTDSLRCLERIYRLADEAGEDLWKAVALMNMGIINQDQKNYDKALE
ncbi:MAG: tetratricopeptide repeat protein [Promethearchaeota archaeon]